MWHLDRAPKRHWQDWGASRSLLGCFPSIDSRLWAIHLPPSLDSRGSNAETTTVASSPCRVGRLWRVFRNIQCKEEREN